MARQFARQQRAQRRQSQKAGGVDAHDAAAHLVRGQVLDGHVERGDHEDGAIALDQQQGLRELEAVRVTEGDNGGEEDHAAEGDDLAAMAQSAQRGHGHGTENGAQAGGGHEPAEAGFVGVQLRCGRSKG